MVSLEFDSGSLIIYAACAAIAPLGASVESPPIGCSSLVLAKSSGVTVDVGF
jgi:hypothetical protein